MLSSNPLYPSLSNSFRDLRLGNLSFNAFERQVRSNRGLWRKLHLSATLSEHSGCVNCVEWNTDGSLLLSGSDDHNVVVWSVSGQMIQKISTNHRGNIFAAKFMHDCNDSKIISGAADGSVSLTQWRNTEDGTVQCLRHWDNCRRVKQVVLTNDSPYLAYACSEDGKVMIYDIRQSEPTLLYHFESLSCKAIAVNPNRPKEVAIGFQNHGAQMFDIRCGNSPFLNFANAVVTTRSRDIYPTVTFLDFNQLGNKLLINVHNDAIYVFDTNKDSSHEPRFIERMENLLSNPLTNTDRLQNPEDIVNENFHPVAYADVLTKAREYALVDHDDTVSVYSELIAEVKRAIAADSKIMNFQAELAYLLHHRASALLRSEYEDVEMDAIRDFICSLELYPMNSEAIRGICAALERLQQFSLARKWEKLYIERFKWEGDSILKQPGKISMKRWSPKTMDKIRDYSERFIGTSNVNTDIKQARFFGGNDEFIAAGSDCGHLFLWERESGNVIKVIKADKKIVNCVAPHPSTVMMATSGLENVVRLWKPFLKPPEVFPEAETVWRSRDVTDHSSEIVRRNMTNGIGANVRNMEMLLRLAQARNTNDDVLNMCRTS